MRTVHRLALFFFILIVFAFLSVLWPLSSSVGEREDAVAARVIDGDTLELSDGRTIRLLGINTPERGQRLYLEAKDFLSVVENESIVLENDWEDADRYGRKLRYVFFEGQLMNVELLQQGLAFVFIVEGLRYTDQLFAAETFARESGIGVWEASDDLCAPCIVLEDLNEKEEFFVLRNSCDFSCDLSSWEVLDAAQHRFDLSDIDAGDSLRIESEHIWNNDGDRFFLRDSEEMLVVFYEY